MARTHGSTSNLTIKFPTLVKALGAGYEGNVVVNRNWFTLAAEQHGFRVQLFPTGKTTKSLTPAAVKRYNDNAKKAKSKPTPKKAKPAKKTVKKTVKPKVSKPEEVKPVANVINLSGESFTVKPANQPF